MTPTTPLRLAVATLLLSLALPGCSRLLPPDPLSKTTSIVNGTQVTRGPSRGALASGFASTAAPTDSSFEPAVGEPFDVEQLVGLPGDDTFVPELQGIDFGSEQSTIADITASGAIPADESSAAYFLSDIGQTVYFDTNSSELTERARETLRRQAAWLNVNADARVTIEGHADERGTREYNLALGDRRASATRGYMIAVGIDEARIDKVSYGKERPVALSSDEDAWAQNRRTETVIEGGGDRFTENALDATVTSSYDGSNTSLDGLSALTEYSPTESVFPLQPTISGTSDSVILDPLFPEQGTTALISTPGTINYETTSGLYPPATETSVFDSTSIAPTVFDPATIAPSPATTYSQPGTGVFATQENVSGVTRIEDVSVDDLLRDPSLIDRVGTPAPVTSPGS